MSDTNKIKNPLLAEWLEEDPQHIRMCSYVYCSNCHAKTHIRGYKVCPHCGAQMKPYKDISRK